MMKRACIAVVLAACGTDFETGPVPDVAEHSGSRLAVEWWETADGALQFRGVFDTRLGAECTFQPDATGAIACVPAGGTAGGDYVQASVELAGYGRLVSRRLRTSDGLVLPYGFYDTARGPCEPALVPGTSRYACAPLGTTATDDDVALDLSVDLDDGHRLERRHWSTTEGLRQHNGTFWDSELAIECAMTASSASPEAYCLPPTTGLATVATDYALAFPTVDP